MKETFKEYVAFPVRLTRERAVALALSGELRSEVIRR
jgi:hypothetical protein